MALATMPKIGAPLTAGMAMGIVAVFNGVGRLIWGSISDRLGRVRTMCIMGLCAAFACAFVVRGATGIWPLLAGLCLGVFAFGGYLAVDAGRDRGLLRAQETSAPTTGWCLRRSGFSGFFVPRHFAGLVDAATKAGDVAAGYNQIYLILAGMAVAAGLLALALQAPRSRAE